MISTPEKIRLPLVTSDDKVEFLVNWNEDVGHEYVKIRINNEQEFITPISSLAKIAMLLAKEEQQIDMVPTKTTKVRHLSKVVTIKLKRDLPQGFELKVPVNFNIPLGGGKLPIIT